MPLVPALIVLVSLLVVSVSIGVIFRIRQGRPHRHIPHEAIDPRALGADELGARATLVQFSSEMCAHCATVHRTLAEIAEGTDGVMHLDVDLTRRPDLARRFHVLQTPTTLILDADGVTQTRFGGPPRRDVLELELARVTGQDARV